MPIVLIDDLDDPRIAAYRHLKATNATRHLARFVVEGEVLVDRLLAGPMPAESVLVTDRALPRMAPKVPADLPLYVMTQDRVEALVGFDFHRGVLACGLRRDWPSLAEVLRSAGPNPTLVACPGLDKPDNLGAILRVAEAFGVAAVLLGDRAPDPLSRRVIRTSMGSALRVPVHGFDDLASQLDRLRADHGFRIVGADCDPVAIPLDRYARPDRLALLLGPEATGLDPSWLALADDRVTIPLRAGVDSLNVAVAAGVLLYGLGRN